MKVNVEVKGLDSIEDSIKDIGNNLPAELALQTTEDLQDTFTVTMHNFYATYHPKKYQRTQNLESIGRPYTRFANGGDTSAIGGFLIQPSKGKNYTGLHSRSIGSVGTTMFFRGIRYFKPSGIEDITDDDVGNANESNFEPVNFTTQISTEVGSFSGTPEQAMGGYFKAYISKSIPDQVNAYVKDRLPLN